MKKSHLVFLGLIIITFLGSCTQTLLLPDDMETVVMDADGRVIASLCYTERNTYGKHDGPCRVGASWTKILIGSGTDPDGGTCSHGYELAYTKFYNYECSLCGAHWAQDVLKHYHTP